MARDIFSLTELPMLLPNLIQSNTEIKCQYCVQVLNKFFLTVTFFSQKISFEAFKQFPPLGTNTKN